MDLGVIIGLNVFSSSFCPQLFMPNGLGVLQSPLSRYIPRTLRASQGVTVEIKVNKSVSMRGFPFLSLLCEKLSESKLKEQAPGCKCIIPASPELRQEDCKFNIHQGYRPCLNLG